MNMNIDNEAFKTECTKRAPAGAVYASVFDCILNRIIASCGSDSKIRNLYSTTKSLCGLVIAHDVMTTGYDIHKDVSDIVAFIIPGCSLVKKITLAHLMHHTGGVNDVNFADPATMFDLMTRKKNTHSILADYVCDVQPDSPFNYSPILGYMLVGAIYELDKRKTDRDFSIRDRCQTLFFTRRMNAWHWRMCDGQDVCNHTFAFSDFEASGEDMLELGINLFRHHRDLLDFIMDSRGKAYVKHARSSRAGGTEEGTKTGEEVFIDYDYSYGWWIIPRTGVLTTIGLGGQYIVIDTFQELIGIRQQGEVFMKERGNGDVRLELFRKKKSFVTNSHETFPIMVCDIYFGIDPDLETSRMMSVELVDKIIGK